MNVTVFEKHPLIGLFQGYVVGNVDPECLVLDMGA